MSFFHKKSFLDFLLLFSTVGFLAHLIVLSVEHYFSFTQMETAEDFFYFLKPAIWLFWFIGYLVVLDIVEAVHKSRSFFFYSLMIFSFGVYILALPISIYVGVVYGLGDSFIALGCALVLFFLLYLLWRLFFNQEKSSQPR